MTGKTSIGILIFLLLTFAFIGVTHQPLKADSERIKGSGNVIKKTIDINNVEGVNLATIGDMYIEYGDREELVIEAEDNIINYFETKVKNNILKVSLESNININTTEKVKYYLTLKKIEYLATSSAGDIHAPDIQGAKLRVKVSSAGDINLQDIDVEDLDIDISSAGDVDLGVFKGENLDVDISSAGDMSAERIDVSTAEISLSSAGDVRFELLTCDFLEANLSSAGDMRIKKGKADEMDVGLSSSGDFHAQDLLSKSAKVRTSSVGDASVNVSGYLDAKTSSSGSIYVYGNPSTVDSWSSSLGRVKRMK